MGSNKNNIIILKKRINLYKEFSLDLVKKVHDTFPGSSTRLNETDFINHYNWCYDKISEVYEKQEIYFKDNDELREYFEEFFLDNYYSENDNDKIVDYYYKYWNTTFDYKNLKKEGMNTLTFIFKKFNVGIDMH